MLMAARFLKRQISMIQIVLRIQRADIFLTDKQPVGGAQLYPITTEIDQRVSLSPYLAGRLLRL